ncbi:ribosomal protein L7/L12 [Clostridium estertheticum]|uniref:ribosomal protein L7/L12 n=1 Tax=Clostridium estertheticum TaxID=238834 RepID=UPI00124E385B|nr:ribosomal protein L7/L12 [Clostridium estertheticum]MBZ9616803.1 ribosomal protein L7/L12 [Clostridium estertheticum subsp. laramiense]WAG72510.1 ribosomal protein L7/L12 [Clostridium estertheticum]
MGNLIKCPMCDKDISPNAVSCPNCGEPMKLQPQETIKMEEHSCYNLVLESCTQKIKTIKLIRQSTGLGLKEAKEVTDFVPSTFMFNVDINKVNKIKQDFEAIGAKVNLVGGTNTINIESTPNYVAKDNLIKCPNCKSVNCNKISGASKAVSAGIWGIFSVGKLTKTWECKSCGYRW